MTKMTIRQTYLIALMIHSLSASMHELMQTIRCRCDSLTSCGVDDGDDRWLNE